MSQSKKELRAQIETLKSDLVRYRKALAVAHGKIDRLQAPPPAGRSVFAQRWDWLADHADRILKGGA